MNPVRKVSNHGKNIIGYLPSLKMKRMVSFESLIEHDFIYVLDFEPAVERFCEQPLTIEYQHEGKKRRYTPDFHIVHLGQDLLVECKPQPLVNDPVNQIKFEAARQWCQDRGWFFGVMTDAHLATTSRVENIKLLTRFARYTVGAEVQGRILAFLAGVTQPVAVSDVMRVVSPEAPQQAVIPILHMAFHHQVYVPLNAGKITVDSPITLRAAAHEKGLLPL